MGIIKIKDLRSIKNLEFEIPTQGIHVLTGSNGCGKTSLLITLNRICNSTAFSNFKLGRKVGMDKFTNTKITYSNNINSITYRRSNRGWEPTPKGAKVNSLFTYTDCYFITTTGFRFYEPNPDQFYKRGGHVVYTDAPIEIKNGLNEVFATTKFDNLKYVTISSMHGRQKKLHRTNILYVIKEPGGNVYSEMNFSLGERLVLNTLDFSQSIPNNVLLLIDEIELALHPTAQIRFYKYIERITNTKNITCIISTHSSSLIKVAKNRIYLDNKSGIIDVVKKCEPAYILKELTLTNDNRPDYLFFVEDIMAWRYLNEVIRKYQETEDKHVIIYVTPVGGYEQVVQLTESFYSIPPFSRREIQAFPDADVQGTWNNLNANAARTPAEQKKLDLLNRNRQNISILDITPELGVWNWLTIDASKFERDIFSAYGTKLFSMQNIINQINVEEVGKSLGNPRNHAKGCFKNLSKKLHMHYTSISESSLIEILFRSYVTDTLSNIMVFNQWKTIFKSIFNRR